MLGMLATELNDLITRTQPGTTMGTLIRRYWIPALLSEEIPDDRSRLGRARVWMVDPIDGTSDFIAGNTGFVVMIGLVVDGRPRALRHARRSKSSSAWD